MIPTLVQRLKLVSDTSSSCLSQLRELEQELSDAKRSGSDLDATRANLEAQLAEAYEERDLLAAREASLLATATDTEAQSAESAAEATRQVCTVLDDQRNKRKDAKTAPPACSGR